MIQSGLGKKGLCMMALALLLLSATATALPSQAANPAGGPAKAATGDWITKPIRVYGYGPITSNVAYSPDGTTFITGSGDGKARLFDIDTGALIRTFAGHTGDILSVAFSPDGTKILTASQDNTAKLWDTAQGTETYTFTGHEGTVFSVAFSPDGTQALTGSGGYDYYTSLYYGEARLWDLTTGTLIRSFTGHGGYVRSVVFSPDGTQALTGSEDNTAKLWDTATGAEIRTFAGHTNYVMSVAFSPNGTKALTASWDNTAKAWDVATGAELHTLAGHSDCVSSVVFSPDGSKALTGSYDSTAKLWDTVTGMKINTFTGHTSYVVSVAFSPDGTKALTGSQDYTARLWDTATGTEIRVFSGHMNSVNSVAFSQDGSYVLTGSDDGTAKLWETSTGTEIRTFVGHTGPVTSGVFSPDGTKVLTGAGYPDGTAKLWDTGSANVISTFAAVTDWVYSVAFSPDGSKVLTGSGDSMARMWDATTGEEVRTFMGHQNAVFSVAFSPDGTKILTGSSDYWAKLWDAATGTEIHTYTGHISYVASVAYFPDGKSVLTGSNDGTAIRWATSLVVPDLTWTTEAEATAALAAVGLTANVVANQCNDEVPEGLVMRQAPAPGTQVDVGTTVALVISAGPCQCLWNTRASMPTARSTEASAISVVGRKITVIGSNWASNLTGKENEEYDPSTNTWTRKADYPRDEGRSFLNSGAVVGDEIFLFGGNNINNSRSYDTVDKYNPFTDTWTTDIATYPSGPIAGVCTVVYQGGIYCVGGGDYGAAASTNVYLFDPLSNTFTPKAPMLMPITSGSGFVHLGKIWVGGGREGRMFQVYDPEADSWSYGPAMPTLNGDQYVFWIGKLADESICLMAGSELTNSTPAAYRFTPADKSWNSLCATTVNQDSFGCAAIGGSIYCLGGGGIGGAPTLDLVQSIYVGAGAVNVPDVLGLTLEGATTALNTAGVSIAKPVDQCSDSVPAGSIISQDPSAGTLLPPDIAVTLTVANGPCLMMVPDVLGMTLETATTALTGAGFAAGTPTQECNNTVAAGSVISQYPVADTLAAPLTEVALVISTGPCNTMVPDVVGLTEYDATLALTEVGFTVTSTQQCFPSVRAGNVISQDPAAGMQVGPGTTVTISVSLGKCEETVPNVVGLTQDAATTALTAAGLTVGTITQQCSSTVTSGTVISQTPTADTQVSSGSAVALVVSTGPCNATVPDLKGLSRMAASEVIINLGLVVGITTEVFSVTVGTGCVVSHTPAAFTNVSSGAKVDLVISAGPPPVAALGVVGYWPFDNDVKDYSGNGNDGTGGTDVPGVFGRARGVNLSSIAVPGSAILNSFSELTVSCWFNPENDGGNGGEGVMVRGKDTGGSQWYGLYYASSSVDFRCLWRNTPVVTAITGAYALEPGAWYHLTGTFDGTNARIYVHNAAGSLLYENVSPSLSSPQNIDASTSPLYFGQHDFTEGSSKRLIGQFDEAVIFNRALTREEAALLSSDLNSDGVADFWGTPSSVSVPNVLGLSQEGAVSSLNANGLTVDAKTQECSATVPSGMIISQDPAGGTQVAAGSVVKLTVSTGPCNAMVPNVVGLTEASASSAITSAGLAAGVVTQRCSNTVTGGLVISQDPAGGTQTTLGTAIALVVSAGPCVVGVPDVAGMTQEEAATALTAVGLNVGTLRTQCHVSVPVGKVISQNPMPDALVSLGGTVTLTVSTGPCSTTVPNVGGMTQEAATTAIAAAGLTLGNVSQQCSTTVATGLIISQSPVPGLDASSGAAVNIVLSLGPNACAALPQCGSGSALFTDDFERANGPVGNGWVDNPPFMKSVADPDPGTKYIETGQFSLVPSSLHTTYMTHGFLSTSTSTLLHTRMTIETSGKPYVAIEEGGTSVQILFDNGSVQYLSAGSEHDSGVHVTTGQPFNLVVCANWSNLTFSAWVDETTICSQVPFGPVAKVGLDRTIQLGAYAGTGQLFRWDYVVLCDETCESTVVPNVVGMTQEAANPVLAAAQVVSIGVTSECSDTVPAGSVASQNPEAGVLVPLGASIILGISTGPCTTKVTVPNVAALTQESAAASFTSIGLTLGEVTRQCSNTVASGLIISQTPAAGEQVPPSTAVALVISTGACEATVPNVVGQTQTAATNALTTASLTLGEVTQQCSTTVASGSVISQIPAAGTQVSYGSSVALVISTGPCNTPVPDVVGQTQAAATTALTTAGLTLGVVTQQCSGTVPSGSVISQAPAAGAQVSAGAAVALVVSTGSCDVTVPNVVGQTQTAATTALTTAALAVGTVTQQCSETVASGFVVSQNPAAATQASSGTLVALVISTGPCPAVPAAPVATLASDIRGTGFTAHWDPVTGATGYRLDISTSILFNSFLAGYENLDMGTATSRAVTGLNPDTLYHYRVRAYNGNGTSANSNIANPRTANTYTFTGSVKGSGTVTTQPAAGAGGTYAPGTPLVVKANPALNWTFDHWEGDLQGTADTMPLVMNADRNVVAVFRLKGDRTLQGTITNSLTGKPVAGVYVEVSAAITKAIAHATTGTDGKYTMTVREETAAITFTFACPEYLPQTKNFTSPPTDPVNVALVPVGVTTPKTPMAYSGPRSVFVDWTANPEYNLKGYYVWRTVADAEGIPSGTAQKVSGLITKAEFTDTSTAPATHYIYQIQALSGGDRESTLSPASEQVKAQFLTVFTPKVFVDNTLANLYLWNFAPDDATAARWVRVPVSARSAYEVSSSQMQIVVDLPTALLDVTAGADIRVEAGGITSGMSVTHTVPKDGEVSITATGSGAAHSLYGSGVLFDIYVPRKSTGGCGDMVLVPDSAGGVRLYDDGTPPKVIPLELENESLCNSSGACLHGDLNEDHSIDNQDVVRIREVYVGKVTPSECAKWAGDINLDGRVDAADAIQLQRWLANMRINPPAAGAKAAEGELSFAAAYAKSTVRPEVWIGKASGNAGGTITVPVTIRNAAPLTGFSATVNFLAGRDGLNFTSAALGSGLPAANWGISSKENTTENHGSVMIAVNSTQALGTYADTQILLLTFTVGASVQAGAALPLNLAAFDGSDSYAVTPRHDAPGQALIVDAPSNPVQEAPVPNVVGQTEAAAGTALSAAGLSAGTVTQQCSDTVAAGLVLSQNPVSGTSVASGTAVALVVSTGPCSAEGEGENTAPTEADLRARLTASFAAMDTDGNGSISYAEALAALPGLTQAVFNAVNASGTGQITRSEAGLEEPGGCSCSKGAFTADMVKDFFSTLFLGGLSLTALLAFGKRRP